MEEDNTQSSENNELDKFQQNAVKNVTKYKTWIHISGVAISSSTIMIGYLANEGSVKLISMGIMAAIVTFTFPIMPALLDKVDKKHRHTVLMSMFFMAMFFTFMMGALGYELTKILFIEPQNRSISPPNNLDKPSNESFVSLPKPQDKPNSAEKIIEDSNSSITTQTSKPQSNAKKEVSNKIKVNIGPFEPLEPLPLSRTQPKLAIADNRLFVLFGRSYETDYKNPNSKSNSSDVFDPFKSSFLRSYDVYDLTTKSWTLRGPVLAGRSKAMCSSETDLFMMSLKKDLYRFDAANNNWQLISMYPHQPKVSLYQYCIADNLGVYFNVKQQADGKYYSAIQGFSNSENAWSNPIGIDDNDKNVRASGRMLWYRNTLIIVPTSGRDLKAIYTFNLGRKSWQEVVFEANKEDLKLNGANYSFVSEDNLVLLSKKHAVIVDLKSMMVIGNADITLNSINSLIYHDGYLYSAGNSSALGVNRDKYERERVISDNRKFGRYKIDF